MAAEDFSKYGIVVALLSAISYQLVLKNLIWVTLGVGRELQPISDFPNYLCRRLQDPRLQACEDMWLSEETRQLFLACSDSVARKEWMPNIGRFNASGRALNDAIIAMDIDRRKGDSFAYRVLSTPGFSGVDGDGRLHLVGLTGRETSSKIELLLVNAQPAVEPTTKQVHHAPDLVIESFHTDKKHKSSSLKHQQTFRHPVITSPNNIAFSSAGTGDVSFYFTNDHGDATSGFRHSIAPYIGNGGVAYCTTSPTAKPTCHIVDDGYHFPNGLISDREDHSILYVPSAWSGGIYVFKADAANRLERLAFIDIPYPIDNLSQDKNGDIWAAAMPKAMETLGAFEAPLTMLATSMVFRIRKKKTSGAVMEYEFEKMLEDREKEVLPGATTVIHDAQTGRLFLSGVTSPFITVCDKV